jgi:hypothetical protein
MRHTLITLIAGIIAVAVFPVGVGAQTITSGAATIALKSGESATLGELYWISHCKSLLKSTPEAEILDGPSNVIVTVKEAMILPRFQSCSNKVPGGNLILSAKDIDDPSVSRLTVRVTYRTKDGDRQRSQVFNISLLP